MFTNVRPYMKPDEAPPVEPAVPDESANEDPLADFETWLKTQPEDAQKAYSEKTANLLSALRKEREVARRASSLEKEVESLKKQKPSTGEPSADLTAMTQERDRVAAERDQAIHDKETFMLEVGVERAAISLGFADPRDAFPLIGSADRAKLTLVDGQVMGAEDVLKDMLVKKPHLKKSQDQGDRLGNHTRTTDPKKPDVKPPKQSGVARL